MSSDGDKPDDSNAQVAAPDWLHARIDELLAEHYRQEGYVKEVFTCPDGTVLNVWRWVGF